MRLNWMTKEQAIKWRKPRPLPGPSSKLEISDKQRREVFEEIELDKIIQEVEEEKKRGGKKE